MSDSHRCDDMACAWAWSSLRTSRAPVEQPGSSSRRFADQARSSIALARALERRSRLAPGESDADAAFAIFADAGRTVNTANPSSMARNHGSRSGAHLLARPQHAVLRAYGAREGAIHRWPCTRIRRMRQPASEQMRPIDCSDSAEARIRCREFDEEGVGIDILLGACTCPGNPPPLPASATSGVGNVLLGVREGVELRLDLGHQKEGLLHRIGDDQDIQGFGLQQGRIELHVAGAHLAHQ